MYRKSLIISSLIFLVATAVPSRIDASAEFVDLARSAKPAVLLLLCLDGNGHEVGSGSGFFVSTDGRLVTNFHVVEDAERMEAELMDGRRIPIVGLLAKDKTNDIAILQADFKPSPREILPLAKSEFDAIQPGERVFVIGAPRGLAGTLSEGIVSAIRRAEDMGKFNPGQLKGRESLLQITAAISPGSSGSPVLDTHGQIIGVAVANLAGGQNLNFAVPVSVVHKLLNSIPAGAVATSLKGRAVGWNLLISAGFFYAVYWGYKRIAA